MTAEEERIMAEHFEYLQDLVRKKKVFLAGPCFDPVFGLIILRTSSEREAVELIDNEPSVRQKVHTYELHPMRVSLVMDHLSPERYVTEPSERVLRKETIVSADLDEVWTAWTTAAGVKTFFAPEDTVELRVGGPYEIYFDRAVPYGLRGSDDCRILSFLPREMLSFEWNAPPQFGRLRDKRTRVVVQLYSVEPAKIKVALSQLGWGEGADWDKVFDYFERAWSHVLNNLQKRFEDGPLDWSAP